MLKTRAISSSVKIKRKTPIGDGNHKVNFYTSFHFLDKKKDPDRGRKPSIFSTTKFTFVKIKRKTPIGDGNKADGRLFNSVEAEIKRKTPIGDGNKQPLKV